MKKFLAVLMSVFLVLALFCSCSSDKNEASNDASGGDGTTASSQTDTHPQVKVTMENGGEFIIELYPEYAPKTVENFLSLVNEGFYNGLTFHRVVKNFMAQGGDPDGTGNGGSGKTIKGEFASNGFEQNIISHKRGVVSMARSEDNDSASSQFFICYSDNCTALDGQYAAFGMVISGMEVVDAFCDVEMTTNSIGENASPVEPIYISTMTQIQ
ncbi:MAG: peptidylprolyl isomerase [Acutalibacteraceae bacterium]